MTEAEAQALMQHYGIAASAQAVYHFRGFKYGRLQEALDYAELVASRPLAGPSGHGRPRARLDTDLRSKRADPSPDAPHGTDATARTIRARQR